MKILIIAGDNDLTNLGDNAMLAVTARWLAELIPGLTTYVVTSRPDTLAGLLPEAEPILLDPPVLPGDSLQFLRRLAFLRKLVRARRYHSWTSRVMPVLEEADTVLLSGQGVMTDAFSHEAVWRLELLEHAHRLKKPTALFSQGIGVVSQPRLIDAMQRVLPQMDLVTLRSPTGVRFLTSTMDCSSMQLREGGDDGLAYPEMSGVSDDAMRIGVSLRVTNYAGRISNSVKQALRDSLEGVSEEMGAGLLTVPIEPDDALAVGELLQCARPSKVELGLDDLIDRIAHCRLVVAGSYHAAVFALALGKPALCLSFSNYYTSKFEGLCEQFPRGCVLIESDTFSPTSFRERLTSLWHEAPALSQEIITTAKYLVELNQGHYREFTAMFNG